MKSYLSLPRAPLLSYPKASVLESRHSWGATYRALIRVALENQWPQWGHPSCLGLELEPAGVLEFRAVLRAGPWQTSACWPVPE